MLDTFLRMLWPNDIPSGNHMLLWSRKPDPSAPDDGRRSEKRSWWCRNVREASDLLRRYVPSRDRDWYVGCCLSGRALGSFQRCKATDVTWLPGLWLDMDINDGVHKKSERLPGSVSEAVDLLRGMPLPPSVIIHSGGGVQGWWFLDAPVELVGDDSEVVPGGGQVLRSVAAGLMRGWNDHLLGLCARRGWTTDAVHDLARVMRLPGTWNVKRGVGEGARATGILESGGVPWSDVLCGVPHVLPRYSFEGLCGCLSSASAELSSLSAPALLPLSSPSAPSPACAPAPSPASPSSPAAVPSAPSPAAPTGDSIVQAQDVLSSDTDSPCPLSTIVEGTLDALFTIPKFEATWTRRRDFLDQSLSSYDGAIALFCVNNEVTDDVTMEIVKRFRLRNAKTKDEADKAHRQDYLLRTVRTAHEVVKRNEEERVKRLEDAKMKAAQAKEEAKTATLGVREAVREVAKEKACEVKESKKAGRPSNTQGRVGRVERLVLDFCDAQAGGTADMVENARTGILGAISERLGMDVEGLTVFKAEPSLYRLAANGQEVTLGPVTSLLTYSHFRAKVADGLGFVLPTKMEGWDSIVKGLNAIRVVQLVGDEGTDRGLLESQVEAYLKNSRVKIGNDVAKAVDRMEPFVKGGKVHIVMAALVESSRELQKVSPKLVATYLRAWGATPVVVGYARQSGDAIIRTTTRAYLLPHQERWTRFVSESAAGMVQTDEIDEAVAE